MTGDPFALASAEAALRASRRGGRPPPVPDVPRRSIGYGEALRTVRWVVADRAATRARRFALIGRSLAARYDRLGVVDPPADASALLGLAFGAAYVAFATVAMVAAVRYFGGL